MCTFRKLIRSVDKSSELLRITQTVDACYELGALLKQAEAGHKAILFESVQNSPFTVAGGLLTSPGRFGQSLNHPAGNNLSQAEHARLVQGAIQSPIPATEQSFAPSKDIVLTGDEIDCRTLPVPTFFKEDTGPFMTAAVGICRNSANEIINAGFYRVLMLGRNSLAVSASPSSGLYGIMQKDKKAGRITHIALIIGAEPALLMAAAAKVPENISELDVAGALQNESLATITAESSDLFVPANAEFVIEVAINHAQVIENTMGEFGDCYGTQLASVGEVKAITHREKPIFHTIMAGAGKEHNALGLIVLYGIEPDLNKQLQAAFPQVKAVRVLHDPPRMGTQGDVYIVMQNGHACAANQIIEHVYSLTCGPYPISRTIRRVVLLDEDIDITNNREVNWAISIRATSASDYLLYDNFQGSGGLVRIGIDARAHDGNKTQRLLIPGARDFHLDDYQ